MAEIVYNDYDSDGMERYQSPFKERCKPEPSSYKLERGFKQACEAHHWMEEHPSAFMAIYDFVKSLQLQGAIGRLRERVVLFCMKMKIDTADAEYKFPDSVWPAVQRYLVLFDSTLKECPVITKLAFIDYYGLFPVSWLNVEVD